MSQFYSSCKLRLSLAIISCILLSQLLMPTEATSGMITNTGICSSLNVGHGPNPIPFNFTVTVSLVHTMTKERSFCYKANTNYTINMRTNAKTFKGLLMVQDKPDGQFPTRGSRIPNFRFNLCERSVSHQCSQPCELGASLNLPYTSPPNENNILEFRYSVVFSYRMYYQNVKVRFHPCPNEPTSSINTMQPTPTCNASEYKVGEITYKARHACPNSPKIIVRHHIFTENNIDYNCTIDNGGNIKRKVCGSGCLENGNGEVLCCRVRYNEVRMRNSTCIAISDVPEDKRVIHKKFRLTHQRKCDCFRCKDVCPSEITETATDDSNNVETSRSDSSVEIDGNMLS